MADRMIAKTITAALPLAINSILYGYKCAIWVIIPCTSDWLLGLLPKAVTSLRAMYVM